MSNKFSFVIGLVVGIVGTVVVGVITVVILAVSTFASGAPVDTNEPIAQLIPAEQPGNLAEVDMTSTTLSAEGSFTYEGSYLDVLVDGQPKSCMQVVPTYPLFSSTLYVNLSMCWPTD